MTVMTARQPRRPRRRVAPAASLPRPVSGLDDAAMEARSQLVRRSSDSLHHRQHHVNKDYSYVHRDLVTVAVVGSAVIGFIVAMSFVVG